ncbi:hypothetical protein [Streptomyces seoulensis]|uniref:hypothetical protein n=1 Tax=Streptomyces seoulensis TaxID=73044 RepID=UPI001FCB9077|nr:hypothetical protein [Streptomyces seoulensis]BDH07171.1 membrane protein [Streptomyces seoulensis]
MTHLLALGAAVDLPLLLAAGVPAALALALTAWTVRRRGTPPGKNLRGPAVHVAALAALGCTAYSADTSWRFAADYLDMAGTAERAGMFAAAELSLFATALMARQNLAVQGTPGLPGTLVWVITTVQVIPAFAESGPIGGTVRAFVGPIMAATLWHLAMGIEVRLRTPGAASHGLLATLSREARERLLSRLGIAARDRDAAQITRDRATARAVDLAARLAERTAQEQQSWRGRRLTRRLSRALGRASVGTDPRQRALLLDLLAARRHALALATVPLASPWSPVHQVAAAAAVPSQKAPGTPTDAAGPGGSAGDREPREPSTGLTDSLAPMDPGTEPTGDQGPTHAGTEPTGDQGPTHAGTEPTGDQGPTHAGTEPTGDQGPTHAGTEPTGDQGHKVPLRRETSPKTKGPGIGGRSRTPQTQHPSREPERSVGQLVQQVRPHVPALLDRDGNESVTRVQLREILRREGLKGGRNDRLSLVLQELRTEDTTKTRSTR